jgi:Tripartite tricarboxylate transporter family receptor
MGFMQRLRPFLVPGILAAREDRCQTAFAALLLRAKSYVPPELEWGVNETGRLMRQSSRPIAGAAACWLMASIVSVGAQPFPSQTIRIVAGAAGNPGDIISRIVANELGRAEGWRVIVENKPGGMQTIAAAEVLKQSADGYTILQIALPTAVAPALLTPWHRPTRAFAIDRRAGTCTRRAPSRSQPARRRANRVWAGAHQTRRRGF